MKGLDDFGWAIGFAVIVSMWIWSDVRTNEMRLHALEVLAGSGTCVSPDDLPEDLQPEEPQ